MFIRFVIGWVAGLFIFYSTATAWTFVWGLLLAVAGWALVKRRRSNAFTQKGSAFLLGFIIGLNWANLDKIFLTIWPKEAFNQKIWLEVQIIDLPKVGVSQFGKPKVAIQAKALALCFSDCQSLSQWQALATPKIKLSWYQYPSVPRAGEVWRLRVKLKPNHGNLNPAGFDYESYLFANRIAATGYLVESQSARRIAPSGFQGRSQWVQLFQQHWQDSEFIGLYSALLFGDKSQISSEQWQVLQATGTVHLMAISGLHIGLLAWMGYFLFAQLWRRLLYWRYWQSVPKAYVASVGALFFATGYMMLAGFSVPTQRAWLMVVSVLIFILLRRRFQPGSALALAAFLVTLWEPRSVLLQGFWLSFFAVVLIFITLFHPRVQAMTKWQTFLLIQLVLTLGLLPLVVYFYQQIPLFSYFANMIAVPWVSLFALPVLMVSMVVSLLVPQFVDGLIVLNDGVWSGLWWGLAQFAEMPQALVPLHLTFWQGVMIYITALGFYFYRRLIVLWIGGVSLLWLFWPVNPLENRQARVSVLDVGQGLSVVVETRNHLLVYDTGAKWSDHLDGASMAILPYLKHQGKQAVDLLIVSHEDGDHAGGTQRMLEKIAVEQKLSGQPQQLAQKWQSPGFVGCHVGQQWQWDGVEFEILAPKTEWQIKKDNDYSCVLSVRAGSDRLLITGDLSQQYEAKLVEALGSDLQANWLIAGHHGSRYSTSAHWLQTVRPKQVIYSSGFLNRFHFPHPDVVARVNYIGAQQSNTACSGMIQFGLNQENSEIYQERKQRQKWFYSDCGWSQSSDR